MAVATAAPTAVDTLRTTISHDVGKGQRRGKKRHLKLFIHPPSIPTKFQTFHFDDREEKGFNSTAPRFNKRLDELPGPGYYRSKPNEELGVGGSFSQKGYGVGFISKSKRFHKPPTDLETSLPIHGNPTKYNPREPTYSHSVTHNPSPAFRSPIVPPPPSSAIMPSWGARFDRPTPGPGYYAPERTPRRAQAGPGAGDGGGAEEAGARSAFVSRSKRSAINEAGSMPGKDAPPPGAYVVQEETIAKHVPAAVAAFKATARPNLTSKQTVNNPGPGAYNLQPPPDQSSHIRRRPGPPLSIAPIPPRPATPLSNHVSIPGSNVPPIANPGPGRYDLAAAADIILRKAPSLNAAFVSSSPRFGTDPDGRNRPGPGFYKPIDAGRMRSFHLNLESRWT
ncbi:hypothetical protein SpCBS45565_g05692 [Spizellomyces sp. 'palustris']|nr:hypothetical protein SpCBS45565_g05692 [Spizellomyces sp. 'palustris']